jgi:hypothetical protein
MAGSYAALTEPYVPLGPQPGLHVQADWLDPKSTDADVLWSALNGPVTDVLTGVRVAGLGELGETDLWATITEPGLARLTITGGGPLRGSVLPLLPFGALATTPGAAEGLGLAGLLPAAPLASSAEEHRLGEFEIAVRGFGPLGAFLAEHLAGRVAAWQSSGRPRSGDLVVTAYPRTPPPARGAAAEDVPEAAAMPGEVILDLPHTRLVVAWPPRP